MNKEIKTILISPHSDDIAFSIGGSLLQNYFTRPILMVTIFSRSNYSPCIKMSNSEMVSKVRHFEDVDFTNKLKIEFQSFNFSEPTLRGHSRKNIFVNKNTISDPIYIDVYHALSKLIKSYQCELIVSPLGLGNHIDHINISDICLRIAKENNIRIIFYEDLHYASRLSFKQIKKIANSIDPNLEYLKINITPIFYDKIENVKLYKTQARRIFQTSIKLHALRIGIENKNLKELIVSYNLFKYLVFIFTNKCVDIPLYERLWILKKVGNDEHSTLGP